MTVEEFATATTDTTPAAVIEAPIVEEALSEDAQLESAWSKLHPQERVDRGGDGKFVSLNADTKTPPEGGEGEAPVDASTVAADVPLPANWNGLDEVWAKIPADARAAIAEHQQQQHAKLSDFGRKASQWEPLQLAASEFAEYFNGNLKGSDGQPIHPADGIRYLANIQRMMDKDPVQTLLSITDTYGAREKLAAALGVKVDGSAATDTNTALLAKIDRLERVIQDANDPSKIEEVVERRETKRQHEEEVRRLTSAKPLYSEIPEEDMVFYINKAWKKLGDAATKAAVLDHAYNAAVEADPALRAKSQAAKKAAEDTAAKAEAAKRGASVNVKSTAGSGALRVQSDDDAMEETWRRLHA